VIEVGLAGREGTVGMASAFDMREAMHTCQVIIGGTVMKIRTEFVIKIVQNAPELTAELVRSLNGQLRHMSRRVLCNRYHTVEQRLCTWMLMVSERCGRPSIRITHNDAARGLGVHRPTITDAMALLSEQRLIEQSTGRITILDQAAITKLACDCINDLSLAVTGSKDKFASVV
jgi:CRP-like cAMP-binding protein